MHEFSHLLLLLLLSTTFFFFEETILFLSLQFCSVAEVVSRLKITK